MIFNIYNVAPVEEDGSGDGIENLTMFNGEKGGNARHMNIPETGIGRPTRSHAVR